MWGAVWQGARIAREPLTPHSAVLARMGHLQRQP